MEGKSIGYSLLGAGLFVMLFAVGFVTLMFLGKISPVKVLSIPAPTFNTASMMPDIPGIPKPAGQNVTLIPTDAFNKLLNMGINFFFMGFILSFGFKLADLGIKLLRPVKVEAKYSTP